MIAQAVPLACFLQLIVYVSSQFDYPLCKEYFQILKNDSTNESFGRLEVPSTVQKHAVNVSINLRVHTVLNTSYSGKIKLDDSLNSAVEKIYSSKPLKYNVLFPTQDPLPQITGISLNNRQLCSSPKAGGPVVTNIVLQHFLTLPPHLPSPTSLPVSTLRPRTTTTTSRPPSTGVVNKITTTTSRPLTTKYAPRITNKTELTKPHIKCGTRVKTNPLIHGGKDVKDGDWPWVVAIFMESNSKMEYMCAGTLLSDMHVLTAAHCVQNKPGLYTVVLGRKNVKEWRNVGSVNKEVQRITVHPKYLGTDTADSDLAVVLMNSRVEFNWKIVPICLWTGDTSMQDYVGQYGVVVGWGNSETSVKGTETSAMIEVQIASQIDCLKTYQNQQNVITDRTFCAGRLELKAGPCNGDSGTGFVMKDNSTDLYYLRGIVSLALSTNGKCDLEQYVVYVNVAHYTSWIKEQIAKV